MSRCRISSSDALRLSNTAIMRAPMAYSQSRSFWKGRYRWDWASQLDPMYQRYARIRTLKTRAKLLKSIRRRGAFEWDVDFKPFFTPRHLRWASHWRGRQWYTNDDPKQKSKEEAAAEEEKKADEDGYELSKREKEWKEQMEDMRHRIAQDPYEAIFGKRFEPFWSPLVPSWMREEMGLQGWPKEKLKEVEKTIAASKKSSDDLKTVDALRKIQEQFDQKATSETKPQESSPQLGRQSDEGARNATPLHPKPFSRMTREERIEHVSRNTINEPASKPAKSPFSPPRSYAYASSTSWDSVSKKTRKVEWDSASNQTKKFEYDPISNRMVEVEIPDKVAIDSDSSAVRQSIGGAQGSPSLPARESNETVEIPVKQSSDVRKSIPIPPPLSQPSHSITLGYTQTSIGPLKSTAISSASVKPAALAKLPAQDLDMLTADHVRASMGKVKEPEAGTKAATAEEKAELEFEFDSNVRAQDAEVEAILKERAIPKDLKQSASSWDRAELVDMFEREVESLQKKKEKLMNDERGLFHIERQKRELQKLDDRIKAVTKRVEALNLVVAETTKPTALQTSLQRAEAKMGSPLLQSSVERMQSRDRPKTLEQDLDDAAAHESTEPVDANASVPKEWNNAADLLQADRVKRTAAKRPYPMTRWVDDMNARKVAYEHEKAKEQADEDAKNAESNAKLEKINKMLQAEVAEQKFKMQAFEGRYAQKVKSLRGELDTAFKQSSVHSEKHVERIRELEVQLSGLKNKETKYADKVKSLRGELERAYKQSAVHAEKQLERIKYLENELENAFKKPAEAETPKAQVLPAEGDICVNAPSFGENGKWYKRPANPSQPSKAEMERAEQKAYDQALVEQVQGIYEREYGVIDENHEQPQIEVEELDAADSAKVQQQTTSFDTAEQTELPPKKLTRAERKAERRARKAGEEKARQVVEVESDVDLGEELAKYEQENPEAYKVEETLTAPESAEKMKSVIAESLERELTTGNTIVNASAGATIQWTDPPLYKVLAYDSGNDMMSSATTTTSVLPGSAEERPLGIPEALSQLYQPARFVPYFAELQSDNFQAIAATREVIVFRQVKKVGELVKKSQLSNRPQVGLEDHGLDALRASLERETARSQGRSSDVNPIDGTSRRHLEPTTGNFASPTGFVNHDPVFPPEPNEQELPPSEQDSIPEMQSDTYSTIAKEPTNKTSRQIWESLPGSNETPVKRTESVFSGMTKKERSRYSREQQTRAQEANRQRNLRKKAERQEEQGRSKQSQQQHQNSQQEGGAKSGGKTLKYMLGAGVSTATVMYLVGALAEKERGPDYTAERATWPREMLRKVELERERQRLEDEAARLTREWERR